MTCSVEFGHGWTRLREVVLPFPQGWLSEQNMRTRVKITKRKECVPSLAGGYFHAHTRISPTLISVKKMRSMVGRRVSTRKRRGKRNFGKRDLRVLVSRELKGGITRDDSQRLFLAQHSVAMLEQCCNHSKQWHSNVATLCCAKNCRCESSRVTSP